MREAVVDTETTGLDPTNGDRIVEIGVIKLLNHMPTGETYHQYINPQRTMPKEAFAVHGLGDDFLCNKPVFAEIASDFLDFIDDAKLVIHNAPFDMKFINAELDWIKQPRIPFERVIDTLTIARERFPGSPASLDALCRRFGIITETRTLHGALLDSELLAEVYLELMGGRQPGLTLADDTTSSNSTEALDQVWRPSSRPAPLPERETPEERARHSELIDKLGDNALWRLR